MVLEEEEETEEEEQEQEDRAECMVDHSQHRMQVLITCLKRSHECIPFSVRCVPSRLVLREACQNHRPLNLGSLGLALSLSLGLCARGLFKVPLPLLFARRGSTLPGVNVAEPVRLVVYPVVVAVVVEPDLHDGSIAATRPPPPPPPVLLTLLGLLLLIIVDSLLPPPTPPTPPPPILLLKASV